MRKAVAILLAFLFLGVSSRATVYFHYCAGRLVDWSFQPTKTDRCSKCGMMQHAANKCCKDQSKTLKLDNVQHADMYSVSFVLFPVVLPFSQYGYAEAFCSLPEQHNSWANAPPGWVNDPPLFLLNQNFRV